MPRWSRTLLPILLLPVLFCGKKGDPHPPVPLIPKSVIDLSVTQRGPRVILSWSYPSLTTSGVNLKKISRIVVYRVREALPPSLVGREPIMLALGEVPSTIPSEVALFAKVPPLGPLQFTKLKEKLDSLEGAEIPASTAGARIVFEDTPAPRSEDGRPVRLTYAVITEAEEETSGLSNLAIIVPLNIPAAPDALIARSTPEAIVLNWTAPVKSSDTVSLIGYNVYRSDTGSPTAAVNGPAVPINTAPVRETTYRDTPPYGVHQYAVTAVTSLGPPKIESDPSRIATVDYRDLLPPAIPTGFVTLNEDKAVRLVWDPVDTPDLAGYRVYRTLGTARQSLTPKLIQETNFRDPDPALGVSYVYSVTSVDKNGNESAEAKAPAVLLPR